MVNATYLAFKIVIQIIVDCSKDKRSTTSLPVMGTTLEEICPHMDETEKGTNLQEYLLQDA